MALTFLRTHELGLLCHRCAEFEEEFSRFFSDCDELEIYATQIRYPSRINVENHNAEKALKQALRLYEFVKVLVEKMFKNE
jgi:HEPN domain-containing protein